ncbi:MAG: MetS family NSS transporter small subunit [Desulfobacteraceae bacterium]
MSSSAIIFMIFGLLLTWGGAAVCIFIAMKKRDM